MNEQESKNDTRKINVTEIESVQIDGGKLFVREVRIVMKSGDVLIFEPYLQVWDKGINSHIREKPGKLLKS